MAPISGISPFAPAPIMPSLDGMAETPSAGSRAAPAHAIRCGVCGTESRHPPFRPAPPEQAPDLDLRPGEPVRSSMGRWLQQCPACGYAAPDITRAHPAAAEAVRAAPFRALLQESGTPPLARRFLAWALVLEETGALHAAAEATLHAAWVADDLERPELARSWRLDAVALWRGGPPLDAEQTVRIIDALRRAEAWGDAGATAEHLAHTDPPEAVAQVIALERRLIAAQDCGRHTVASALPPPARRPHASHQRIAPRGDGFWARLKRLFGSP
jgi:ribosomal protein L37E